MTAKAIATKVDIFCVIDQSPLRRPWIIPLAVSHVNGSANNAQPAQMAGLSSKCLPLPQLPPPPSLLEPEQALSDVQGTTDPRSVNIQNCPQNSLQEMKLSTYSSKSA